jgi:hypothetical protein
LSFSGDTYVVVGLTFNSFPYKLFEVMEEEAPKKKRSYRMTPETLAAAKKRASGKRKATLQKEESQKKLAVKKPRGNPNFKNQGKAVLAKANNDLGQGLVSKVCADNDYCPVQQLVDYAATNTRATMKEKIAIAKFLVPYLDSQKKAIDEQKNQESNVVVQINNFNGLSYNKDHKPMVNGKVIEI